MVRRRNAVVLGLGRKWLGRLRLLSACKLGVCLGGSTGPCTDNDPCTTESCAGGKGCVVTGSTKCDDGNPCTIDYCKDGYGCAAFQDIGSCNDGDPCTTGETCIGSVCKNGVAKDCDDKNACTADTCDAVKGCVNSAIASKPCDDGDSCTAGDTCTAGVCKGTVSATCDDGNPCTKDICGTKGCEVTAIADGQACGTGKVCKTVVCVNFCVNDTTCPNSCVCNGGTCAFPAWTADGQYAFPPDHIVAYHPFLDEYWTMSSSLGNNKGPVVRYKPDGTKVGGFVIDTSSKGITSIRQVIGDPDSETYYVQGPAGPDAVMAMGGPGKAAKWAVFTDYNAGGIFINGPNVSTVNSVPIGTYGFNAVESFDRATGSKGKLAQFNATVPYMGLPNLYQSQVLVGDIGNQPNQISAWKLVAGNYNKVDTKIGLQPYTSITVRGDRVCLSKGGVSACYAMAKVCK